MIRHRSMSVSRIRWSDVDIPPRQSWRTAADIKKQKN
jgi:hypothetical protein